MSNLKKYLFIILAAALIIASLNVLNVLAANSCRISFSDPSCHVGDTVSVSVSVTGAIAAADINLVYSTDYLEYVSVSGGYSSGGNGSVRLYNMYNSGSGDMNFTITFKARTAGTGSITVTSYDIVDGNGDAMDVTCGSSAVTITNVSSDSSLSSLSISPGSLSPAFSPSTTNYSVSVSNSVGSITVSAVPNDSQARASVSGGSNLSVGNNTITVTVTAGNGSTTKYYINVNRAPAPGGTVDDPDNTTDSSSENSSDSSSSIDEPIILYAKLEDGTELEIGDFKDDDMPSGFKVVTYDYKNSDIAAISHDEGESVALYLIGNDKYPTGFYFYDAEKDVAYPIPVFSAASTYIIVDFPSAQIFPEKYSLSEKDVNGLSVNVLVPTGIDKPNHYLLCAINPEGSKNIYLYDIEENTLQRYDFALISEAEEPVISPDDNASDNSSANSEPTKDKAGLPLLSFLPDIFSDAGLLQYILIAFLIIILILTVICLTFGVKNNKLKKDFKMFIVNDPEQDESGSADFTEMDSIDFTSNETIDDILNSYRLSNEKTESDLLSEDKNTEDENTSSESLSNEGISSDDKDSVK